MASTPNYKFLRNFFMAGFTYSQSCWQKSAEGKSQKKIFHIYLFDDWPGIRTQTQSLISRHTTYYKKAIHICLYPWICISLSIYWMRHLKFFYLVFIMWVVIRSSCLLWQTIWFILPLNEYGYVYAWTLLANITILQHWKSS